jgi:hypothetical protein
MKKSKLSTVEQVQLDQDLAFWQRRHRTYLVQQAEEAAYREYLADPTLPKADPPHYDEATRRSFDASPGQAASLYSREIEEAFRTLKLMARARGQSFILSIDEQWRLFAGGDIEAQDGEGWYARARAHGFIN